MARVANYRSFKFFFGGVEEAFRSTALPMSYMRCSFSLGVTRNVHITKFLLHYSIVPLKKVCLDFV